MMLRPQIHQQSSVKSIFPYKKPFLNGNGHGFNAVQLRPPPATHRRSRGTIRAGLLSDSVKAIIGSDETTTSVKAVVTVLKTLGSVISPSLTPISDGFKDLLGRTLRLELVSAEFDPKTGAEKPNVEAFAHFKIDLKLPGEVKLEATFKVPPGFGEVGAVLVENRHGTELFLKDIVLEGPNGPFTIQCRSFVQPKDKRVFFASKSFLPSQTPDGLKRLRENELTTLRGNGKGKRNFSDRIYDYDVYNDLGDPDKDPDLARPVLGGDEHPYPRRCRTGRSETKTDPSSEKRALLNYVPRDEVFSDIKTVQFGAKAVYSALHAVVPTLESLILDPDQGFANFAKIEALYNEGIELPSGGILRTLIPRLIKVAKDARHEVLRFETPETFERDRFLWLKDEEFGRQTLAGLHPLSIKLVTEWPLKSNLDSKIYGSSDSAITTKLIEEEIKGYMTVEEAIERKKLFILDHHDILLPYVEKIRKLKGRALYGSRTIFFLTPQGTMKPLAIELTRPPMDGKPQWKQVFKPSSQSTASWLWQLAKAHVVAHDSVIHQLVSHWLRTHCCTEPYIIAANRQLSAMHPIYRLLRPHFKYTMEINALARLLLINADGIIESTFSSGKYSVELSSAAYDKEWRFDCEGLPKDLIRRGMAVEDPNAPHGVKVAIEDYPYANDGLVLWDNIKQWVSEFVNHYYPESNLIESDQELQAWWSEIRNIGHVDKKEEQWWPNLKTQEDLVEIVTTMVWVTSGHHAAVNFGQYAYGGYFPNRPTIARIKMPNEDPSNKEWEDFVEDPETVLMKCFPSQIQATKVMTILDVLSSHSPDEEYLGDEIEPAWAEDPVIKAAFDKFNERLKEFEGIVDDRNANNKLLNRTGAGVVPYELLKPFSESGVTGKGVPYSISI